MDQRAHCICIWKTIRLKGECGVCMQKSLSSSSIVGKLWTIPFQRTNLSFILFEELLYYRLFLPADVMQHYSMSHLLKKKERNWTGMCPNQWFENAKRIWEWCVIRFRKWWIFCCHFIRWLLLLQIVDEKRESILLMICEWKRMDLRLPWGNTEAHQVLALWWLFCTDRNSNRPTGN